MTIGVGVGVNVGVVVLIGKGEIVAVGVLIIVGFNVLDIECVDVTIFSGLNSEQEHNVSSNKDNRIVLYIFNILLLIFKKLTDELSGAYPSVRWSGC